MTGSGLALSAELNKPPHKRHMNVITVSCADIMPSSIIYIDAKLGFKDITKM